MDEVEVYESVVDESGATAAGVVKTRYVGLNAFDGRVENEGLFPVHFEPVCILMFRLGDPILLTGPESDQYALLAGQIPDVRVLREFTHPNEDYPFSKIQSLAEIVADMGMDARRIKGQAWPARD